jgi:hypothetical protein
MPTTILYPNETIFAAGWWSGSNDLHTALQDSETTNYISASAVTQQFSIGFDNFSPSPPVGSSFAGISEVEVQTEWACMPRRDVFQGKQLLLSASNGSYAQISATNNKDYYGLHAWIYETHQTISVTQWGLSGASYTGTDFGSSNPLDSLVLNFNITALSDGDGIPNNTELRFTQIYIVVTWDYTWDPPPTYTSGDDVKIEEGLTKIEEGLVKVK